MRSISMTVSERIGSDSQCPRRAKAAVDSAAQGGLGHPVAKRREGLLEPADHAPLSQEQLLVVAAERGARVSRARVVAFWRECDSVADGRRGVQGSAEPTSSEARRGCWPAPDLSEGRAARAVRHAEVTLGRRR
jgi:hypothetical protein